MLLAVCFFVELLRLGLGPVLQYPEVAFRTVKYGAGNTSPNAVGQFCGRAAPAERTGLCSLFLHTRIQMMRCGNVLPLYPDVSKSPTGGVYFIRVIYGEKLERPDDSMRVWTFFFGYTHR